ncbi:MAG: beta-ketoacyl-ACP synthase III [Thermodesulfobacteriota bacterium]
MARPVYITGMASFLPGQPVTNDQLDNYLLGSDRVAMRTRRLILKNNGIDTRHYAIEPGSGGLSHSNAQLAAAAVRELCEEKGMEPAEINCLSCGTSSPDQLMPGHASMVHGELGAESCEINSSAGICLSGIMAMKYAAMTVALGLSRKAVATGSELASTFLRPTFFQEEETASKGGDAEAGRHPAFSFAAEFLRWMLSDGAGAMLLEDSPAPAGPSLKVEWIEIDSQAHRMETCMYAGGIKEEDGSLKGWRDFATISEAGAQGAMAIKQDARLLNREVIRVLVGDCLPPIIAKHQLSPDEIDWFLPHYSSAYFRQPLFDMLTEIEFPIPFAKWFTNLATRGNTGSASFYIMLAELFASGRLKEGEKILCFIPESGRFAVGYILLTVVSAD